MLKGRLSIVMDDAAYGAHPGMMVQMEHTPRIHRWMTLQMGAQPVSTDG